MRLLLACLLLLGLSITALANDSRVTGESGRVRRVSDEKTTVRMVREAVRMDLYAAYYDVAAEFVFHNDGPATTVRMGFPERGAGDVGHDEKGFQRFATWVDGRPVTATRQLTPQDEEAPGYDAFWVKDVPFAAGQTRTVRVEYRAVPGDDTELTRWATYGFTGGNWAGTVAESTLLVRVHTPGATLVATGVPMQRNGNQFAARWTNWQAELAFEIYYLPTRPDALLWPAGALTQRWLPRDQWLVNLPGKGQAPTWAPPGVMKDGVAYLALPAVATFLQQQAEAANVPNAVQLRWDARANRAELRVGRTLLQVGIRQTSMLVNGRPVPLPARTFLSQPINTMQAPNRSYLYVPAKPLVEAFGGRLALNTATRELSVAISLARRAE